MRRYHKLIVPLMMLIAWSAVSIPAGHASQNSAVFASPFSVVGPGGAIVSGQVPAGHTDRALQVRPAASSQYSPNQILVKFKSSVPEAQKQRLLGPATTGVEKLDVLLINVPAGQMENTLARLNQDPGVEFAEPNYIANALDTIPNDPYWSRQYGLVAIHAPQAWDLSTGGSTVTIAVIDSGVDLKHADLAGKLVPGYDFVAGDNDPQDENGHGSHVAGIAAAASNNKLGIAGVSWGAKIMPVRVLNAFGSGTYLDVANGIIWATDQGAQVLNLSLGGSSDSLTLKAAVDYALSKNVIIVAATGNDYSGSILYPAHYAQVIAVGATNALNIRADFSNYGNEIDLVAPGVSIYSLAPGSNYMYDSGTSMSTPHVSGLAAILLSIPGNQASKVEAQMESSALDLGAAGWDIYYGHGLIQMDVAILLAQSKTPTPGPSNTPASPTSTPSPTKVPGGTQTPGRPPEPSATPAPVTARKLPETGFAHAIKPLPIQPAEKKYLAFNDMSLEIPSIHVSLPIVGVPWNNDEWDVTWLGQRAGWLNGTSFPTWAGNSVITGHVWDAANNPGPFFELRSLRYGDLLKIHAWGQVYTYQVRENNPISSTSTGAAFQHEDLSWVTLLTCEGYDSLQDEYLYRRMVRAVLIDVNLGP